MRFLLLFLQAHPLRHFDSLKCHEHAERYQSLSKGIPPGGKLEQKWKKRCAFQNPHRLFFFILLRNMWYVHNGQRRIHPKSTTLRLCHITVGKSRIAKFSTSYLLHFLSIFIQFSTNLTIKIMEVNNSFPINYMYPKWPQIWCCCNVCTAWSQ